MIKWFALINPNPENQFTEDSWSLEHVIDYNDYNKLIQYVESLGIKELTVHNFRTVKYSGFTSHGFYQSLDVKCTIDKMDLIKEYISNIPRCTKDEMQRNENQSDKLLSSGVLN